MSRCGTWKANGSEPTDHLQLQGPGLGRGHPPSSRPEHLCHGTDERGQPTVHVRSHRPDCDRAAGSWTGYRWTSRNNASGWRPAAVSRNICCGSAGPSQMETLDEWNVELVLVNSHDAGSAYQLHAGIFRRICSNGLVLSDSQFEALRFRHSGLEPDEVVSSSLRLIEFMPRVGELVQRFRDRVLDDTESRRFAEQALLLRYPNWRGHRSNPRRCFRRAGAPGRGDDLWNTTMNRVQEADPGRRVRPSRGPARATAFGAWASGALTRRSA